MIDYFLKVTGADGESKKEGHENEIEILSWSWGASNPGSMGQGGGGGTGRVSLSDISFSMFVGKASPKLLLFCTNGKHIDKVTLSCRKSGGDTKPYDYLVIELSEVIVSSYQTGGSSSDSTPVDSFSLNFTKIDYDYKVQDSKSGAVSSAGKVSYDSSKAVSKA